MEETPRRRRKASTSYAATPQARISVGNFLLQWRSSEKKKERLDPIHVRYPKGMEPPARPKKRKKNYSGGDSDGDEWASEVSEDEERVLPDFEPLSTPKIQPIPKSMNASVQTDWSLPSQGRFELQCDEDGSFTLKRLPDVDKSVVVGHGGLGQRDGVENGRKKEEAVGEEIAGFDDEEEAVLDVPVSLFVKPVVCGDLELIPVRVPAHRRVYTREDDEVLIRALLRGNNSRATTGVALWQNLEGKILPGRTWGSLKNRFLRNIKPNLDKYDLTPEEMSKLR